MGAMRKVVLMSLVMTFALGQVDPPGSWLDGILDFISDIDMLKWVQNVVSEFGEPMRQNTDHQELAGVQHVAHHKVKKMVQQPPRAGDGGGRKSHEMKDMHLCHEKCQPSDEACHMKCPKPWGAIEKTCEEVKTIKTCHKSCGHDFACHKNCPMPACAHNQHRMQTALDCHGQCFAARGGRPCHASCPKPMKNIAEKCQHFQEVRSCHMACGKGATGRECHVGCRNSSPFHNAHGGHAVKLNRDRAFMQRHAEADGEHIEVEHAVTVALSFELDVQV